MSEVTQYSTPEETVRVQKQEPTNEPVVPHLKQKVLDCRSELFGNVLEIRGSLESRTHFIEDGNVALCPTEVLRS